MHLRREFIRFAATGDPEILATALAQAPPRSMSAAAKRRSAFFSHSLEHDIAAAARTLAASPRDTFQEVDFSFYYPRAWYEAIIARAAGDEEKAQRRLRRDPQNSGGAPND